MIKKKIKLKIIRFEINVFEDLEWNILIGKNGVTERIWLNNRKDSWDAEELLGFWFIVKVISREHPYP